MTDLMGTSGAAGASRTIEAMGAVGSALRRRKRTFWVALAGLACAPASAHGAVLTTGVLTGASGSPAPGQVRLYAFQLPLAWWCAQRLSTVDSKPIVIMAWAIFVLALLCFCLLACFFGARSFRDGFFHARFVHRRPRAAVHLDDVMIRRSSWKHYHRDRFKIAEDVATWMAEILRWTDAKRTEELKHYLELPA